MARREPPIAGDAVPDQGRLRPLAPVRDLDEFLRFLQWIEAMFGPIRRRSVRLTTGDRFLL